MILQNSNYFHSFIIFGIYSKLVIIFYAIFDGYYNKKKYFIKIREKEKF